MLENQFITPQELSHLHLDSLLIRHPHHKHQAHHANKLTIDKVMAQLLQGSTSISSKQQKATDFLDRQVLSESRKRLLQNRKKNGEREQLNNELYGYNKNKQGEIELKHNRRLLTVAEHSLFIKNMKKDNQKRKELRQQMSQRQEEQRVASLEKEKRSSEEKRMMELQRKKDSIRQNLKKMRQNHEKMVATQHQSRVLFHQIRKKKRLYQQMQQTEQQKSLQKAKEIEKRMQEHRQGSKLDIQQLIAHEKQYLELRKEKQHHRQSSRVKLHTSQHGYRPPQHSHKLNSILEQQFKNRHKEEQNKRQLQEKIRRIAQYSVSIKERFKQRSPTRTRKSPTETEEEKIQTERMFLKHNINRTELGNQYLKQARTKVKKRSKTEERYYNPEASTTIQLPQSNQRKQKVRMTTLNYIPESKRKEHIEKMKRQEIQKILKIDSSISQTEKLERVKLADERLSYQLRKRQQQLKDNYTPEANSATLALLLGTIRAKLNLISSGHR